MEVKVKEYSTFWVINVLRNGEVIQTWTGQNNNKSWYRECLKTAFDMEKNHAG